MKRLRGIILVLGPAAFALMAVAPAMSSDRAVELDQSQPAVDDFRFKLLSLGGGPSNAQRLAQTVTAGTSGLLSEVRLPVSCTNGTLVVEIQGVGANGAPNGLPRASATVAASKLRSTGAPSFRSIRFEPAPSLVAGERYAIVLHMEDPARSSCGLPHGPSHDPYPAGAAFFGAPRSTSHWSPLVGEGLDLAFQTFVTAGREP